MGFKILIFRLPHKTQCRLEIPLRLQSATQIVLRNSPIVVGFDKIRVDFYCLRIIVNREGVVSIIGIRNSRLVVDICFITIIYD